LILKALLSNNRTCKIGIEMGESYSFATIRDCHNLFWYQRFGYLNLQLLLNIKIYFAL